MKENAEQQTLEKGCVSRDNTKQRGDGNTPEKKKSQQVTESTGRLYFTLICIA